MLDYADTVKTAFALRHGDGGDLTNSQKMNTRQKLAKALLVDQYSHLKDELDEKALAQQEKDTKEWNLVLDDISSAKDVPQYVFPPFSTFY